MSVQHQEQCPLWRYDNKGNAGLVLVKETDILKPNSHHKVQKWVIKCPRRDPAWPPARDSSFWPRPGWTPLPNPGTCISTPHLAGPPTPFPIVKGRCPPGLPKSGQRNQSVRMASLLRKKMLTSQAELSIQQLQSQFSPLFTKVQGGLRRGRGYDLDNASRGLVRQLWTEHCTASLLKVAAGRVWGQRGWRGEHASIRGTRKCCRCSKAADDLLLLQNFQHTEALVAPCLHRQVQHLDTFLSSL